MTNAARLDDPDPPDPAHVYQLSALPADVDRYPLRLPGLWTNVTYQGRTICLYQQASRETVDQALAWLVAQPALRQSA